MEGVQTLVDHFADLPDSRVVGRTSHDVLDIVVIALCGVMSGAEGWDDIEDWARERVDWLRQFLKLRNGVPGHDTIRRVFEMIRPEELETRFEAWVGGICPSLIGKVLAIDGKAVRGSGRSGHRALHMVSVFLAEHGMTLAQRVCPEKSNEITAIKELLPALALQGTIVTIDAMGCQTEIAAAIIEGGGDYVLAVKDNQPNLAEAIRDFFSVLNQPGYPKRPISFKETLDKGHGRVEIRRCTAVDNLDWLELLELKAPWVGLKSVVRIESIRHVGDEQTTEVRYFISSLPADSARILHAVRSHWAIENSLHWCLDVTFGDDASKIHIQNAAHNFALLRRIALNVFRSDASRKLSLPKKLKLAAWNSSYLASVLNLRPI